MTTQAIIFTLSAAAAYLGHEVAEWFLKQRTGRKIRLVIKKHQIHHSFFGLMMILLAINFFSGVWAIILYGYGLGNIWQHKITHNRTNESGMVFISKILK